MSRDYSAHFSNDNLRNKVSRHGKSIGRALLEKVFQLWFALQDPATPAWAWAVIIGALGYFISPIDAVPDLIPGVGYVDDAGVIASALAALATNISEETRRRAEQEASDWLD